MSKENKHAELMRYVEQWGILFEQFGASRMMGRVLGWLLVCDPPMQTAREIAHGIGASIGSISTTTRTLVQMGMIERLGVPRERSAHFRIRTGAWARVMKRRTGQISAMKELVKGGEQFLTQRGEKNGLRLKELQSYCSFVEREFPALFAKWEEEWKREVS
jgi:DNA-binding transcriptional regulator GbsR (MarR family)